MNSWQKICILFPLNRELLMCIYNSILSTRRFDWHHLQVGPFIHCYDINYIYETEWNQTDRSERARTTLENLRVPCREVPLPPRAGRPFKAAEAPESDLCWNRPRDGHPSSRIRTDARFIVWHNLLVCCLHPLLCSALGSGKGQVDLSQIILIITWSSLRFLKQSYVFLLTISHRTWFPNSPLLYICLLLDNSVLICHCPSSIWGMRTKRCT